MIIPLRHLPLACLLLFSSQVFAQPDESDELGALRAEIRLMRSEYESRIADLEARLDAAEKKDSEAPARLAVQAAPAPAENYSAPAFTSPQTVSVARDNSFNPAIGVIFQGQAWSYSNDPGDYYIPGFPTAGESGLAPEGLSLAETEISMSANVDDKFTAKLTLPVAVEDGDVSVELEEAWVETMTLPAGLAIRMGRIMSEIGYMNDRHFHSWDFADQPLPYQAFLGGQYIDDGLQFRWMAPTDFYLELGAEVFRGGSYPAEGQAQFHGRQHHAQRENRRRHRLQQQLAGRLVLAGCRCRRPGVGRRRQSVAVQWQYRYLHRRFCLEMGAERQFPAGKPQVPGGIPLAQRGR